MSSSSFFATMDLPITESSLQGDFPDDMDEFLEDEITKCIMFNRRGKLLAAGCIDGRCVLWDFETLTIVKELIDDELSCPIISVCWSRCGHRILASSADKSLTMWDVKSGNRITRIVLAQNPQQAHLHPRSCKPSLCLACPLSHPPMIVDLNTGETTLLEVSVSETNNAQTPASDKKPDGTTINSPTPACFNKYGNLVYLGNSMGEILVIDYVNNEVQAMVPIPGVCKVRNIVFSRNGQYLLTNSSDRVLRIFENLLPLKDEDRALNDLNESLNGLDGVEKLKVVGSKCLTLIRKLEDSTVKVHWTAPNFSSNGELVVGGSACKGAHKIYIWDRDGLVKLLEGPGEGIIDLTWHPVRPVVVSVSSAGVLYIWVKYYKNNLKASVPKMERSEGNEDQDVDIIMVEKDTTFSDSDMSEEELCFLPTNPIYDAAPKQRDWLKENSSKLVDNNNSSQGYIGSNVGSNNPSSEGEVDSNNPRPEGNAEEITESNNSHN